MKKFIRIGVNLAKNYFRIHALESEDGPSVRRKLTRLKMREFFSGSEPCVVGVVGMETCASAHYWARELKEMGHNVLLMPPSYTKHYVKCGKNGSTLRQSASRCHVPECASFRSRTRSTERH